MSFSEDDRIASEITCSANGRRPATQDYCNVALTVHKRFCQGLRKIEETVISEILEVFKRADIGCAPARGQAETMHNFLRRFSVGPQRFKEEFKGLFVAGANHIRFLIFPGDNGAHPDQNHAMAHGFQTIGNGRTEPRSIRKYDPFLRFD